MSANVSSKTPDARFVGTIKELRRQVRALKTNQNRVFVVPGYTADPASPVEGQMWRNTTTDILKIRLNGVTRSVTVT